MLPGLDGFELPRIREVSATPIIILTAKGADEEKVRGLWLWERRLRDEAVFGTGARRASAPSCGERTAEAPPSQRAVTVGELEIDLLAQQVTVARA